MVFDSIIFFFNIHNAKFWINICFIFVSAKLSSYESILKAIRLRKVLPDLKGLHKRLLISLFNRCSKDFLEVNSRQRLFLVTGMNS